MILGIDILCFIAGGTQKISVTQIRSLLHVRESLLDLFMWTQVCSEHLTSADYASGGPECPWERTWLIKGAVPSVFPWTKIVSRC